jgi:hypothetical protein
MRVFATMVFLLTLTFGSYGSNLFAQPTEAAEAQAAFDLCHTKVGLAKLMAMYLHGDSRMAARMLALYVEIGRPNGLLAYKELSIKSRSGVEGTLTPDETVGALMSMSPDGVRFVLKTEKYLSDLKGQSQNPIGFENVGFTAMAFYEIENMAMYDNSISAHIIQNLTSVVVAESKTPFKQAAIFMQSIGWRAAEFLSSHDTFTPDLEQALLKVFKGIDPKTVHNDPFLASFMDTLGLVAKQSRHAGSKGFRSEVKMVTDVLVKEVTNGGPTGEPWAGNFMKIYAESCESRTEMLNQFSNLIELMEKEAAKGYDPKVVDQLAHLSELSLSGRFPGSSKQLVTEVEQQALEGFIARLVTKKKMPGQYLDKLFLAVAKNIKNREGSYSSYNLKLEVIDQLLDAMTSAHGKPGKMSEAMRQAIENLRTEQSRLRNGGGLIFATPCSIEQAAAGY